MRHGADVLIDTDVLISPSGHALNHVLPAVWIASCLEPAARILDMSVSAAEYSNKTVLPTSSSSDESECGKRLPFVCRRGNRYGPSRVGVRASSNLTLVLMCTACSP